MRSIPTLFLRDQESCRVYNTVTVGCEWVLRGEGFATRQLDGTACLVQDGALYTFHRERIGKPKPRGFMWSQDDWEHQVVRGWRRVRPEREDDSHIVEAYSRYTRLHEGIENGTYELVGPRSGRNGEQIGSHVLIPHGRDHLEDVPRNFQGLQVYLLAHPMEGIVFWRDDDINADRAKIKRRDFGLSWPA